MRQLRPRKFSKLLLGRRLTGFQHDKGAGRLPPAFVRKADHRHLLHGGMVQQTSLDLDRRDVFATADDDVLQPVADLGVPVRVDDGGIAGVEPAIADCLRRGFRIPVVPLEHRIAPDDDLADGAAVVGHLLAGFRVHDAQLAGGDQLHARPRFDGGPLRCRQRGMFR